MRIEGGCGRMNNIKSLVSWPVGIIMFNTLNKTLSVMGILLYVFSQRAMEGMVNDMSAACRISLKCT